MSIFQYSFSQQLDNDAHTRTNTRRQELESQLVNRIEIQLTVVAFDNEKIVGGPRGQVVESVKSEFSRSPFGSAPLRLSQCPQTREGNQRLHPDTNTKLTFSNSPCALLLSGLKFLPLLCTTIVPFSSVIRPILNTNPLWTLGSNNHGIDLTPRHFSVNIWKIPAKQLNLSIHMINLFTFRSHDLTQLARQQKRTILGTGPVVKNQTATTSPCTRPSHLLLTLTAFFTLFALEISKSCILLTARKENCSMAVFIQCSKCMNFG